MLVLIYEDFRADNPGTVREVLRFLDVPGDPPIEIGHANPSVRMRSQRLDEVLTSVSMGSGQAAGTLKSAIKAVVPQDLRRRALRTAQRRLVHGEVGPPDEALMAELRRKYRPEVESLAEYLDRDVVRLWGYDSLA